MVLKIYITERVSSVSHHAHALQACIVSRVPFKEALQCELRLGFWTAVVIFMATELRNRKWETHNKVVPENNEEVKP